MMTTPEYWLPELSLALGIGSVSPRMHALFAPLSSRGWRLAAAASSSDGIPVAQSADASG